MKTHEEKTEAIIQKWQCYGGASDLVDHLRELARKLDLVRKFVPDKLDKTSPNYDAELCAIIEGGDKKSPPLTGCPTCPECGHEEEEYAHGHDGHEETVTCSNPKCGKDYLCTMFTEVNFSSRKVEV